MNNTRNFIVLASALGAACGGRDHRTPTADSASAPAAGSRSTEAAAGITVPAGFTATVFADTIGGARHAVAGPNGDVYVNTWHSPYDSTRKSPAGGFIVALRDTNRDGRADIIERFGSTSESGSRGGTGIALLGDALYAEQDSSIVRYRLQAGALVPKGPAETIVTGLTTKGGHPMHPIAVDTQGNLFVNMGSASNACQTKDRQPESPGVDPCRELQQRGGIWRFSALRTGQRFSTSARFATGIRNAVGLAIGPEDGRLYSTQHGRDQLAENWPKLFDWKQSANLPAEELLLVEKGADYGWPYCYFDPGQQKLVQAPEYGGDGKRADRCTDKRAPLAAFPAHWAPNALAFYEGTAFPETYRGGVFIAFHGSWNRAPEPQEGYNVVFQPFVNGKPSGDYQVFAEGFAGPRKEPGLAEHRPAGVAVAPDGALIITDDQRGRVWRVAHGTAGGEVARGGTR
ncbi:MAG TPA: PQQ-dependent sugar dehydrogenase [Gemmatimonadales bacterium]|nr:PQQ-dependent sugar dehydrogenase [Gemmatimonadales bacterium]